MGDKEKDIQNSDKKELDLYNKDILDIINETNIEKDAKDNTIILIITIDLIIKKSY